MCAPDSIKLREDHPSQPQLLSSRSSQRSSRRHVFLTGIWRPEATVSYSFERAWARLAHTELPDYWYVSFRLFLLFLTDKTCRYHLLGHRHFPTLCVKRYLARQWRRTLQGGRHRRCQCHHMGLDSPSPSQIRGYHLEIRYSRRYIVNIIFVSQELNGILKAREEHSLYSRGFSRRRRKIMMRTGPLQATATRLRHRRKHTS